MKVKNRPPSSPSAPKTQTQKTVKISEAQLREFVEWVRRSPGGRIVTESVDTPAMTDYRKRLKLGYEPLHKASQTVARLPGLEHHAVKLQEILRDLAALFKEAATGGTPADTRPTVPEVPTGGPGRT